MDLDLWFWCNQSNNAIANHQIARVFRGSRYEWILTKVIVYLSSKEENVDWVQKLNFFNVLGIYICFFKKKKYDIAFDTIIHNT